EAHAMKFIAQHTSIPVPRVIDMFESDGFSYTVMTKLRGLQALQVVSSLSEEEAAALGRNLGSYLAQMRAIPPLRGDCVSNFDGGPLHDTRLSLISLRPHGPFPSVKAFHEHVLHIAGKLNIPDKEEHVKALETIRRIHDKDYPVVLTHCDLNPSNVIVDPSDYTKVVGLVDWESCAWLPAYW
ncbi:kinase-like protein, partial [Fistulina hepatica ATCC 64428]